MVENRPSLTFCPFPLSRRRPDKSFHYLRKAVASWHWPCSIPPLHPRRICLDMKRKHWEFCPKSVGTSPLATTGYHPTLLDQPNFAFPSHFPQISFVKMLALSSLVTGPWRKRIYSRHLSQRPALVSVFGRAYKASPLSTTWVTLVMESFAPFLDLGAILMFRQCFISLVACLKFRIPSWAL